jgi:hypothetical protein
MFNRLINNIIIATSLIGLISIIIPASSVFAVTSTGSNYNCGGYGKGGYNSNCTSTTTPNSSSSQTPASTTPSQSTSTTPDVTSTTPTDTARPNDTPSISYKNTSAKKPFDLIFYAALILAGLGLFIFIFLKRRKRKKNSVN